jgi:hypothetical protein
MIAHSEKEPHADRQITSDAAPTKPISIVDAVCCVHFCAAGKSSLLVDTLKALNMEILIPAEVETEVLRKRNLGCLATQWPRMRASQHVRILDELDLSGAQPQVVAQVARIRGIAASLALSRPKDLGEAVVLGHAAHLAAQGHDVYVVIDDQGGQQLAAAENVQILTLEDVLFAAFQLGLVDASGLRTTYQAMIPFGSGLPTWKASFLKRTYDDHRRRSRSGR